MIERKSQIKKLKLDIKTTSKEAKKLEKAKDAAETFAQQKKEIPVRQHKETKKLRRELKQAKAEVRSLTNELS